ncbi:hypothetical protein LIER_01365 [Lithospermum erythrorhizon]|uniref:CRAL-TRIO domain-containing protein n=1 Tax=Lithospermum erythrorhizon TaxID=34254 RepID=A0AAV3NQ77_LITER
MSTLSKQFNLNGSELEKINEVRKLIGPLSGKLALYCSDSCITRYLKARNWNVNKATKMLKASLKWRLEYKPDEIRWDDVSSEAETGKIYRANYKDKSGRPVLVIRPRCENSKSVKDQIKHFVYCMESAILNLPPDQEQMVWLIDFHGFSLSNISIKVTRETAHVLQEHYPERLGVAVLYDAPKIFEPFWMMAKPFLEPKTANKVKFVYSGDQNTIRTRDELFNMDQLEAVFGGKAEFDFEISKYADRMRQEDMKMASFWEMENSSAAPEQNLVVDSQSEILCSGSNSSATDKKAGES